MGSRENGYINYGGYNANLQGTYPSRQNYNIPPQTFGSGSIPMMVHDTHSIDLKCPNCMGNRILDNANMVLKCPYCDSREVIPAELISDYRRLFGIPEPAPQFVQPSQPNSWQPVQQNYPPYYSRPMGVPQGGYVPYTKPRKRRTLLWILGWLFIFPLPLTILLHRSRKLPAAVRYLLIFIAWIIYFNFNMMNM